LPTLQALKIAISYAIVCPIVIYPLELILTRSFPNYYDEKNWNVGKHVLNNLIVIFFMALGNSFMTAFLFDVSLTSYHILGFIKYTMMIGVFPIIIGVLFSQYQNQKKYLKLSQHLNNKIERKEEIIVDAKMENAISRDDTALNNSIILDKTIPIKLLGQNNNEFVELRPEQIIYLVAADNYVEVHYFEQQSKKVLLRSSLILLYAQIEAYGIFMKCHRSYVINKALILSVSGNAQGLKLKLKNTDIDIPVSRSLNKYFSINS
jgi:hypothetical protein